MNKSYVFALFVLILLYLYFARFWLGGPRVLGQAGLVLAWGGTWVVGLGGGGKRVILLDRIIILLI